jgi:hypothetical protein
VKDIVSLVQSLKTHVADHNAAWLRGAGNGSSLKSNRRSSALDAAAGDSEAESNSPVVSEAPARPKHVFWRTNTKLCYPTPWVHPTTDEANVLLQESSAMIVAAIKDIPGVHVLDGWAWTEDCVGYEDFIHHSSRTVEHIHKFLAAYVQVLASDEERTGVTVPPRVDPMASVVANKPVAVLKWSFQTAGSIDGGACMGPNGSVLLGSADSTLYSLSATTGQVRWQTRVSGGIMTIPTVSAALSESGATDGKTAVASLVPLALAVSSGC